ncbi:hypothetical protein Q7P37_007405 [Cladosporium fusiforme]
MCHEKKLNPIDYQKNVLRYIHTAPSDDDVEPAARGETPPSEDVVHEQERMVLRLANNLNPSGRANNEPSQHDYEMIFDFMPRRSERPVIEPFRAPLIRTMVSKWLHDVKTTPDPRYELCPLRRSADVLTHPDFFRKYLPKKLDIHSWTGSKIALSALGQDLLTFVGSNVGVVRPWQAWMGPPSNGGTTCKTKTPTGYSCSVKGYVPFIGTGGEGRWVWRYNDLGVPTAKEHKLTKFHAGISKCIKHTEKSLVRLSIQIANWLASWLVMDTDIVRAVVEILGDEWFELPFDDQGLLKKWKTMRSMFMSEMYFHLVFDD